jgi:RNA polymerase sigma-70 factor (ECF subfamily)
LSEGLPSKPSGVGVSQSHSEISAVISSEDLFRVYATFVAKFLRHLGVHSSDLDDVVQEVFMSAHRKGGYRPGPASPATFLARLALDARRWVWRRNQRFARAQCIGVASSLAAEPPDTPENAAETVQALEQLQCALDSLDAETRAIFVLFELEQESCAAIAAGLELKLGTVYSRLHYGRAEFRKALARAQLRAAQSSARAALGRNHGLRPQALTRK